MNSPDRPSKDLNLHILLKSTETGGAIAAIAEISECRMEIIPLTLPLEPPVRENSWMEFIGMFEGDAEFAEMAEALRQERGIDLDNAA
jgi:hypothetical protein